ncbi:MAG: hypothetical protein IPF75_07590 [Bacteroidetes bacterium]|nr:hypothetical protein [Bacteroidota bacterium]
MEHNFHDEKDNIKNLNGKEAIDKLKNLLKAPECACLQPSLPNANAKPTYGITDCGKMTAHYNFPAPLILIKTMN